MGRHLLAAPPVRPARRADPVAADVRVAYQWPGDQRCSRPVGDSMEACLPGRQPQGRVRPGRRDRRIRPEDERPTHDGLSGGAVETDPAELFTRRREDLTATTLFIAVKDHDSSYVYQNTRRSRLAQSSTADLRPSNAKLVAVPRCKYIGQLRPSMVLMDLHCPTDCAQYPICWWITLHEIHWRRTLSLLQVCFQEV